MELQVLFDHQLRPGDFVTDIMDVLKQKFRSRGDPIVDGNGAIQLVLVSSLIVGGGGGVEGAGGAGGGGGGGGGGKGDVEDGGIVLSDDPQHGPIYQQCPGGRPAPGSVLEVRGEGFKTQSDMPKGCFSTEFKEGEGQTVDYFRCNTCRINWVCETCATTCHGDHVVVPYIMGHKPSYGCCYCKKKRKCTLG
jgi:hypothetical protein